MQKISPFFWFENEAEEAAKFYVSVFSGRPGGGKNSRIISTTYYDKAGSEASGRPEGSAMTVAFELEGQEFTALNGGPEFKLSGLSGGISFVINCETQEEVDYFWDKLGEGGETGVCGWINHDKFGVTWQVTPVILVKYLEDPDPARSGRVMKAMLQMKKIDIPALEEAYNQK